MQLSEELLARYPIISDQVDAGDIRLIIDELSATLARQVPGDIVEFGCYIGTTSLFIRRVLDRSPGAAESRPPVCPAWCELGHSFDPDELLFDRSGNPAAPGWFITGHCRRIPIGGGVGANAWVEVSRDVLWHAVDGMLEVSAPTIWPPSDARLTGPHARALAAALLEAAALWDELVAR